ncbi:MAG TPA: SUMF1/EgtB/PvdO family nonheme iron enzyme [Opitutaceae bacterium]|nr:SUMF1/EgtB/PvdO family nonheme iron enzyme [Opitutaceae bacterium]
MTRLPLTPERAHEILGSDVEVSREERRRLFHKKKALLKRKMHLALTPGLRSRYREALAELVQAFETLELEGTQEDLESLEATILPSEASEQPNGQSETPSRRRFRWRKDSTRTVLTPKVLRVLIGAALVLGLGGGVIAWQVLERDRAAALHAAAELRAQAERERAAQLVEQARLAQLAREEAEARRLREESVRRDEEARAAEARKERERLRELERQARVALAELDVGLGRLPALVGAFQRQTESTAMHSGDEGDWAKEWSRRREQARDAYLSWLTSFVEQHPARLPRRVADELLNRGDPEGALAEVKRGRDALAAFGNEPAERYFREVGRPLVDSLVRSGDWPEVAFARLRADEPLAVERTVAQLKAELNYLDSPGGVALVSDWRDRLLPLRRLAGGTDPDFQRWQARFQGTIRVTSRPSGATLIDENGMSMGRTPATFELQRGGHLSLTAFHKGYASATMTTSVGLGDDQQVELVLTEIPVPQNGSGYTIPGLGLSLVWIAPGTFTMGSPPTETNRSSDEGPQVRVNVPEGYWLGKYEVTQGEWVALMGTNPSQFKTIGLNGPVESVSWREAVEFCRRLTVRERTAERLPEGYAYTLPTELQWEFACRAGTTGPYAGNLNDMGWHEADQEDMSHVVGQKAPNAWGLYDMLGNVWEWCLDWYADSYRTDTDGNVLPPTKGVYRVSRGGSWNCPSENCRSALRRWLSPADRGNRLGFRLALVRLK